MTIILCGGGSGGHITPLLAVAAELRKKQPGCRLIYIGEKGGKFSTIATDTDLFDEHHFVSAGKLRRYYGESALVKLFDFKTNLLNIKDVFKLGLGLFQSFFLLRKLKADAIFMKGGFVCVPVAVAARLNHVPYLTHDSDALPGLSNRIAARWARYHATAMPAEYYNYPKDSVRAVGVPTDIRYRPYSEDEQKHFKSELGIPKDGEVLLITGGSNGARRLNESVIEIIPRLLHEHPKLHILHQMGAGNEDQTVDVMDEEGVSKRVKFFGFSSELFHMSGIADVIIARAGASFIAEFSLQNKALVIVPNPYLTGGHQLKNAEVYKDADAAVIVPEDVMLADSGKLYHAVDKLLNDPEKRESLGKNLHSLTPETNASTAIADLVLEIAK